MIGLIQIYFHSQLIDFMHNVVSPLWTLAIVSERSIDDCRILASTLTNVLERCTEG